MAIQRLLELLRGGGHQSRMAAYDPQTYPYKNVEHENRQGPTLPLPQEMQDFVDSKDATVSKNYTPFPELRGAQDPLFNKDGTLNRQTAPNTEAGLLGKMREGLSHAGDMTRATAGAVKRGVSPSHKGARQFSQQLDPSDQDSVMQMQEQLNAAGYTDQDGEPLKVDGKMGGKTEFALRRLQRTDNLHKGAFGGGDSSFNVTPTGMSNEQIQADYSGPSAAGEERLKTKESWWRPWGG